MTPTDEQLERWSAEVVMGWELVLSSPRNPQPNPYDIYIQKRDSQGNLEEIIYTINWHPLTDLNQTFMCVEKMREKGWELWLIRTSGTNSAATFCKYETMEEAHRILDNVYDWIWDTNPARAILLAMWRALEVV